MNDNQNPISPNVNPQPLLTSPVVTQPQYPAQPTQPLIQPQVPSSLPEVNPPAVSQSQSPVIVPPAVQPQVQPNPQQVVQPQMLVQPQPQVQPVPQTPAPQPSTVPPELLPNQTKSISLSFPPIDKRSLLIAGGIVVSLMLVAGGIYAASTLLNGKSESGPGSSSKFEGAKAIVANFDREKFKKDTDSDKLPDFIEKEMGYDPNIDEVKGCYNNTCADPSMQKGQIKKRNILIILDSSGSMNLKVGSQTKMDAAKQAITTYVNSVGSQAQIGLLQYGHLGSNSAGDKPISCASADIVAPIGALTSANVSSYLASIKPVGWTPIGLSLQKAKEQFVGKENDINEVYVLTDGAETCDSNPTGAATALANSTANIRVNVIGFAVTSAESTGLQAISTAGKGSYSSANSTFELEDVFAKSHQNWNNYMDFAKCMNEVGNQLYTCNSTISKKDFDYKMKINNKPVSELSREESYLYTEIFTARDKYRSDFFNQKMDEISKQKAQNQQKL